MIKFVTSSEENDEQFKSNLKNFYLLKICLVVYMVKDELRVKDAGDSPQQLNYAVGRLVSVTVYYLRLKFESID